MNRLTNEDYNDLVGSDDYNDTYVYNLIGNRLEKQVTDGDTTYYTYDANNDELDSETTDVNTIYYTYNENGSLTYVDKPDNPNMTYTYNLQNRMASAYNESTTANYTYNPHGIRVQAVVGATTNKYLVDPYNHTGYAQTLKTENSTTGDKVFYAIGHDVISQATNTSNPTYFVYDGHGSTRQVSNNVGTVVANYAYDAYGIMLGGNPAQGSSPTTNLLYAGEHFDTDMQQYYLRARWYNQNNGRFNQMDPFSGSYHSGNIFNFIYKHMGKN